MNIRSRQDLWFDTINYALLAIVGFLTFYPFLYMLILSFNEGTDTVRGGIAFYPRAFTLANFASIFTDKLILGAYKITILKTVIGTVTSVFITGLVGYGLAEKRLPGRKWIMIYMLIPMFFSGGLIPDYLNLRNLGLINTFSVYVIPSMFVIYNCIVMKSFFQQIPEELKESMRIDGAHELRILAQLIFPISLPLIAAISLFVAVTQWNDWFRGAFFVRDLKLVPVQTYLQGMMTRDFTNFFEKGRSSPLIAGASVLDYSSTTSLSLKIAAVVGSMAPILLVYPFLQKYFTKGVLLGSIKG
ncbi:MAG: carbohydrate ABC transporter permease [Paenibacillaceae bacterium]|nr:carbohydrate ABC transporter permease [Paenibacillaceae bacterium]